MCSLLCVVCLFGAVVVGRWSAFVGHSLLVIGLMCVVVVCCSVGVVAW